MIESQMKPFPIQFAQAMMREIGIISSTQDDFVSLYKHNERGYSATDSAKWEHAKLKSDLRWLYPIARALYYRETPLPKDPLAISAQIAKGLVFIPLKPFQKVALRSVEYGAKNMKHVVDGDNFGTTVKKGIESVPSMLSMFSGIILGAVSLTSLDKIALADERGLAQNPTYPKSLPK